LSVSHNSADSGIPGDAFPHQDSLQLIPTEEDYFLFAWSDISTHGIVYRY
jgi:hypothetical protein